MFEVNLKLPDVITDADLRTVPAMYKDELRSRRSGIYAFEDFITGEVFYIGKAMDIRIRVREHLGASSRHRGTLLHDKLREFLNDQDLIISICFTEPHHISLSETLNIEKYKPVWNRNKF